MNVLLFEVYEIKPAIPTESCIFALRIQYLLPFDGKSKKNQDQEITKEKEQNTERR